MDIRKGHQAEEGASGLDPAALRERLGQKKGPEFWRSLDELAETPEFGDMLEREFPRFAAEWTENLSRRSFLQLSSASLALAGLAGCTRQPLEKIVPYVKQPEQVIPGKPLFFATSLTLGGYATGVLAESHMGRPVKIEGNPDHPASLGATDVFAQASVLGLYDPARSQTVNQLGKIRSWSALIADLENRLKAQQQLAGEGLRILTGAVTSPTLVAQMQAIQARFPRVRWHTWEPADGHQARQAAVRAFGRPVETRYDFSKAKVVLAIESDFLNEGPGSVRYSYDFAASRRVRANQLEMSRFYAVESTPTGSATIADHRLTLKPDEVEAFALALAGALGAAPAGAAKLADAKVQAFVRAAAADLRAAGAAALVTVGEYASPAVQVLGHAINAALGNVGSTVLYGEPVIAGDADQVASLRELTAAMAAGRVDILFILGTNPVYDAPADLNFTAALQKVALRIHHGLYEDETAQYCQWHVPAAHELESWGDGRAYDGTASLRQPLIDPLYEGKTEHELLAVLLEKYTALGYDLVREHWNPVLGAGGAEVEGAFRAVLHGGTVANSALPAAAVAPSAGAVGAAVAEIQGRVPQGDGKVTLLFRPDPTIWDGRYASNGWLQELPKTLTKLTWDNALLLSPATAARLKVKLEEVVELTWKGRKLKAAVWILPGQAEDTATLTLGYGRTQAGEVGNGHGFNAYALRTSDALWTAAGVEVKGTGEHYNLACTQNHHVLQTSAEEMPVAMEEAKKRHLIRTGTLEEFKHNPQLIQEHRENPAPDHTLYPPWKYEGHSWGMSIDLNACTGCGACVVACQSENNIPVVGKDQVMKGREMHWLRIDRYFEGDLDDPRGMHFQPLPCMQCENAPCEVVCPVAATSHSDEGLNDMVYNRCVGTRYCSNNCPYKVRRFNFLRYSNKDVPVLKLVHNPDVTVRMRGVMEKCTYCVQRIEQAKISSKVESRAIEERELQTACQQACASQAIVFGDINQPGWEVSKRKADPLNYGILEDLNTRPRTTYLAKLRNPNPQLLAAEGGAERTEHGDH